MSELTYDERREAAYQEGRSAARNGIVVSRFTEGTPMHDAWREGWTEEKGAANRPDRGWRSIGDVSAAVVGRLARKAKREH